MPSQLPKESALKRPRSRQARPMTLRIGREIRGSTAAAQIYQMLRDDIVSARRNPGDPIVEKQLESELGVSRTPIREAILRLAAEHLIEIVPQSGTFVAQIPLDSLPEAIVIRATLEELTVRTAAERATASQVAELRVLLERQREFAAAGDIDAFYGQDEEFHLAIAQVAGYPGVWPLVLQVKVQVDRLCHTTLPEPGRMERLMAEHTAIADAIAAHDPATALAALHRHLDGILGDLDRASQVHRVAQATT